MKKLFSIITLSTILLSAGFLQVLVKPAYAFQNPIFTVNVSPATAGANENVILGFEEPSGTEFAVTKTFHAPAGWNIASGSSFGIGDVVGSGTFTGFIGGSSVTVSYLVRNQDPGGHLAHWTADLGGGIFLDSVVDGDITTGFTFSVQAPSIVVIDTPTSSTFTIQGLVGGVPLLTNPTVAGDYVWSADFTTAGGATVTRSATVSLPGTVTDTGFNVSVPLSQGATVQYGTVSTSGVTTLTSTPTVPPGGTGQFQLQTGGLYYDFNTTATISCPCTVTLTYDPGANPNPRMYHLNTTVNPAVWEDITTSVDTTNHTISGLTNSFSFFAIGTPDFNVSWKEPISKKLAGANPFKVQGGEDLAIKFNLLNSASATATPDGVVVEIWQTKDAGGNAIIPARVLVLNPKLNDKKDRYNAELDLEKNNLGPGTYQIRVLVANTTATQNPATASFNVIGESDDHLGNHNSTSAGDDGGNSNDRSGSSDSGTTPGKDN